MKITYSKANGHHYAHFLIKSALAPDIPIRFRVEATRGKVEAARARLEKNFELLECDIAKENIRARSKCVALRQRARKVFRLVLRGWTLVKVTKVHILKVATHLDERGKNDYRAVRVEREEPHLEWRKNPCEN